MRILVLTINYWPEQTGIGAVLTRRCEYLASAGHEVTVCTGMPFYPEWRVHPSYTKKLFVREKHNGVNILRSWIWVPSKVSSVKRVLFEATFLATSLMCALRSCRPDRILIVSPPLGLAISGLLLSQKWDSPYVFDVQDLQPDSAADLEMLPRPVLPLLYRLEEMAYRNAALISTVSDGMRRRIIGKGIPASKVIVIPPPSEDVFFGVGNLVDGEEFRRKHSLVGKFIVAHSGNMGVKQGLDIVLDTAVRFSEQPHVAIVLAGDGAMKARLERRAMTMKLGNVHFLPLQERTEYLQMLAAVDVALIVQQSTVSDIVFPSKTVTLLSAARPIGAAVSVNSEIGRVILESSGGMVSEPEKPEALAATIREFIRSPKTRLAMGERGRKYARQHWDEAQILPNFEFHLRRAGNAGNVELSEPSTELVVPSL
jgi:colanic acid biosynthesis glycosyl transferase WcaI